MPTTGLVAALADAVTQVHPVAAIVILDGSPRLALTIDETAALLSVNRRNVRAWIDSGELSVLPLAAPGNGNRHYRIPVASVIALVNRSGMDA